jgi:hypothetical protein
MLSVRVLPSLVLRACAALVILGQVLSPALLAVGESGHCSGGHRHAGHAALPAHAAMPGDAVRTGTPAGCSHCPATECAFLVQCAGTAIALCADGMPVVPSADPVRPAAVDATAGFRSLALTPPTPPPLHTS